MGKKFLSGPKPGWTVTQRAIFREENLRGDLPGSKEENQCFEEGKKAIAPF